MAGEQPLSGPDLMQGVNSSALADGGTLLGHAGGESVLLARRGSEIFAIGATCTHYGGPLAEGLVVGETVRCPWHHACFSLRTGEALRAPALNPVPCWRVEERNGSIVVLGKEEREPLQPTRTAQREMAAIPDVPKSIVIVGAGAAGSAAAEMLRREGYAGRITMLTAEDAAPYDRPNLSKDYLAGTAQADWIPLRPDGFYREHGIDLVLGVPVASIDTHARTVRLQTGAEHQYDRLLLATGAEPIRLTTPGMELPHVHVLRSLADSSAIIRAAERSRSAVVLGSSFIGLEVAASLRARKLEVHVVSPEASPLERVLGAELGQFIRSLHEEKGVHFHLGQTAASVGERTVTLSGGDVIEAELVVAGVGVRPRLALAEKAGLALDRGVSVNEYLESSVPGVYAAGDIARWPDPHSGTKIRVEHWVVAQRQGQTAARNMMGKRERFDAVPFFWSQHYDVVIAYVGHAERWDRIALSGSMEERDCAVSYQLGGKTLALATIFRDRESLEAEVEMEAAFG